LGSFWAFGFFYHLHSLLGCGISNSPKRLLNDFSKSYPNLTLIGNLLRLKARGLKRQKNLKKKKAGNNGNRF